MTDLDMVNQALNEIGQKAVTSLDNTVASETIVTANFQLPRVKQAVLRVRNWGFARRRKQLDALDPALSLGQWTQAYRLPPDCVAVRHFISAINNPQEMHAERSVEIDAEDKRILFTSDGTDKIVYTTYLLDVNRWDALAYDCCATRLAAEFATIMLRDFKLAAGFWEKYKEKLDEADGVDKAESGIQSIYDSTLVDVRM